MQPLAWVTLVIAVLTLAFNAVFWTRALHGFRNWRRRVRRGPEPTTWPKVHVLVCLKGDLPRLRETVLALDGQDYSGDFRVTFVTESRGEKAALRLFEILPTTRQCDHAAAGRVVEENARCAQKNFNLLAGIRHADSTNGPVEVYAFCDGDLEVDPGWLREMVRPLATGIAEVSTSFHYATPEDKKFLGALHGMAETCQSIAALVSRGATWGGSMAIRTGVFRHLRLAEVWSRTVVDDMTLSRLLRSSRLRVMPVPRFLVRSRSDIGSYRAFVRWLGRQFFFVKIYLPRSYRILGAKMALNVATLWLATFHAAWRVVHDEWPAGPLAGGFVTGTAVAAIAAFLLYRYLVPERPSARAWLGAALVIHGTSLLACVWATLRRKDLTWRDLSYALESDGSVTRVTAAGPDLGDELEEAVA